MNYRVQGGKQLSGTVTTNISKNAAVALLAASLLNRGETILKRMPRIEEVKRLIEVMESIGVKIAWNINGDMSIKPPKKFDLSNINRASAEKTRSIALFIAPLAHALESFDLPAPRGCDLGVRDRSDIAERHPHAERSVVQAFNATSTSSSIFLASPNNMRLFSL